MFEAVSSVKLQGANFLSETSLPVLKSSDGKFVKLSLIFGRNGSGKSTVAKAFRKIKGDNIASVSFATILDSNNQPLNLTVEERARIFVFDEEFVSENVRIQASGLGSIVMLGEQADLTAQIEKIGNALEVAEARVESTKETLKDYQDETSLKSPHYYIKKMCNVLRGDDGWAGREREIQGLRQNSRVNDDTYKNFVNLKPVFTLENLTSEYQTKLSFLTSAKRESSIISSLTPTIPDCYKRNMVIIANLLLKKKIERPELSERELTLLALATSGKSEFLQERIERFSDEETQFCPYCLQDLSTDYKTNLVSLIQTVLTDEVKRLQRRLESFVLPEPSIELSPFKELNSYQACANLLEKLTTIVNANNSLLKRKIDDSFSPIVDESLSEITGTAVQLEKALKTLEEERRNHNKKVTETEPLKNELISINNQIAHYEIIEFARQHDYWEAEMTKAQKAFDDAVADRNRASSKLEELNAKRKRIDIAVDVINSGLQYIFFDEKRLTIHQKGDFYELFANGHLVAPKDVSVGERNAIGLCYFFASILEGKNKDTAYNDEYLLIIDDPVSSYDYENRVGILSFLNYKLSQLLAGNRNSRVAVMTHDLFTMFDLEKVAKKLKNFNFFSDKNTVYCLNELKNCNLYVFEFKRRHEYTKLLKLVYDYGCGNTTENDVTIGNMMRQVLEAFATFEYKTDIEGVANDEVILSKSRMSESQREYFNNLMYRLVLHGGSHREEQTRSMKIDFFSVISEQEKRRTARDILCLMYLLNKPHIIAHLGENVSDNVEEWCKTIENRSVVP